MKISIENKQIQPLIFLLHLKWNKQSMTDFCGRKLKRKLKACFFKIESYTIVS